MDKASFYTFSKLVKAGKKVTFVFDVPTLANDSTYSDRSKLNECINNIGAIAPLVFREKLRRIWQGKKSIVHACTLAQKQSGTYEAYSMLKEVVVRQARKFQNVKTIDLSELFCDYTGQCNIQKNGKVLYEDAHHLNLNGSLFVAPKLLGVWAD